MGLSCRMGVGRMKWRVERDGRTFTVIQGHTTWCQVTETTPGREKGLGHALDITSALQRIWMELGGPGVAPIKEEEMQPCD